MMQCMAGRTSTLPVHDKATGGQLIPLLTTARDRGDTYEEIAEQVRGLGVRVATTTVYRWCRSLSTEPERVAS